MKKSDSVERPRMMNMMPRTFTYSAVSNLGISVTMKQAAQAAPNTKLKILAATIETKATLNKNLDFG